MVGYIKKYAAEKLVAKPLDIGGSSSQTMADGSSSMARLAAPIKFQTVELLSFSGNLGEWAMFFKIMLNIKKSAK